MDRAGPCATSATRGAVLVWSVAGIQHPGHRHRRDRLAPASLVVGVLVWIGFAHVARWTTRVDRSLAGWQRHEPVHGGLPPTGRARVRAVREDAHAPTPRPWRDLAWLAITSVVGFAGGLVVITAAGLAVSYVSMPLWYWAVTDPHTEYGLTNLGRFTVDTLGEALTMTAIGVVLLPLVLLLARWFATAHAGLAVRLLGPSPDDAGRGSHA